MPEAQWTLKIKQRQKTRNPEILKVERLKEF